MRLARLRELARTVSQIGANADVVGRFIRDVPRFLQHPLSHDEARARVRECLASREQRLLSNVEHLIYRNPRSPYLALLRNAGCELTDFRALVASEGIDGALAQLADHGVYVTYDELKGHRPIVRGSSTFYFQPTDFDNPRLRSHFIQYTGGSTGTASAVRIGLPFLEDRAASLAMVFEAHGVERPGFVCWWPVAVIWITLASKLGYPALGWFYPVHPLPPLASLPARYLAVVGTLLGFRFPLPEHCDLTTPERLLDWLAPRLATGRPIVLRTMASAGVRLAITATAAGRRLNGLTILAGGEMTTPARRRQIEATGARVIVVFSSSELGSASYSCATPTTTDDVHLMTDRLAVIQRPRQLVQDGPVVDALLFTSLSPSTGKVLLNAETGDSARLETRECGCLLGRLGMRVHLSEIRSFEKLTGEGVTFARSNIAQILEEVLPARFGGTSLDYQLAEVVSPEDDTTRLMLRVYPAVGDVDDAAIRSTFLEALRQVGPVDEYQARIWERVGTIEVRREPPLTTRAGKVLPFQLGSRAGSGSRLR
jgi:hypothetical protein